MFRYFATEWMLKNPKGSRVPLLHFRHCDTVQKCQFLENFLMSPKGPPFNFFHILQQTGVSKRPKRPVIGACWMSMPDMSHSHEVEKTVAACKNSPVGKGLEEVRAGKHGPTFQGCQINI